MRRVARFAMLAGTVVAVFGLSKVHAVQHVYSFSSSARFAWAFAYAGLLALCAYGFGLPDFTRSRRAAIAASAEACVVAALGLSALQLVVGDALLPRVVVLGSAVVLAPWYLLCAAIARDGFARQEDRDRIVVVALDDEVDNLRHELEYGPEQPASVVAALTLDAAGATDPHRWPLVDAADATHATLVVLSRAAQADEHIVAQAAQLHESGFRVRTLSLFYEQWLGKLPVGELERVSLMFDVGEVHAPGYARFKRLLDVVTAGLGAIVLVAVIPFVVLGNLFANRGPLLYRQPRIGRHGEPFEMVKFRTMTPAPKHAATNTTELDDPRVTRFGQVLRRTHLDELPQVLNVLRGELSIVGPRPEQPHLVAEWADKLPFYRLRHLVRPGLTGWAQVKYHYAGTEAETLEKLQYEFFYLRRQNLRLDLRIIGRTVRSVIGLNGR